MLARPKPKLSLCMTAATSAALRPSPPTLSTSLMTPPTSLISQLSPQSPVPPSPTVTNTNLNQRGLATFQQPTYAYTNNSVARSILKKSQSEVCTGRRQLQFSDQVLIHCVTPIDDDEYYGSYRNMSREERRWRLPS